MLALASLTPARADDTSAPVILQDFENTYGTIELRMPDIFAAGYGAVYTPPPGRADSGNQSVGYDQYNRFDLGSAGNPTLYGTETGLKALVSATHAMGANAYVDMVWNHNGFSDWNTNDGNGHTFPAAGGYPGFVMSIGKPGDANYDPYGDFHDPSDNSTTGMRLAGLIDIAHEKNYQFIRNPVNPNDPRNLPAGTTPLYGRLANVADPNNARFYPDTNGPYITVDDPANGQTGLKIYSFNTAHPLNGTPVVENATGYLMRNTQWLVQVIGVDGFRIDAAKNMQPWVLNYYDRAVFRASNRVLLNGQQQQIFGYSEVYDSDQNLIQSYIRKDINPATPNVVGGNRDALDFPLFFAMQQNLSSNGIQNDWNNVVNASIDLHDDGLRNGSQGVSFVSSQDDGPPALDNVAYAYTLMMPGNTQVYFNGKQFGDNRSFPQNGREDALGGVFGNAIPALVDLRNRYGRGNYRQDFLEKESYAFERAGSALVLLSNRGDAGFDSRTFQTSFAPGTHLLELSGNAGSSFADPHGDISKTLVVNSDGTVNARFLRNATFDLSNNVRFTGDGYLVYGLPTPQGNLSLTNVAQVLAGSTPDASASNVNYLNGTTRLSNISVIKANAFTVNLNTNAVTLPDGYRDHSADGDNALIKLDGGLDVNGNGAVDFTTPNTVTYGFEKFTTVHSPGYFNANGNGQYAQAIDASKLSEGMHYIDVVAFRQRSDGGPAVYTDFRQSLYVDRLPPNSGVDSFAPTVSGINENRTLNVRSLDMTANSVHVLLDLPAADSNSQILSMLSDSNHTSQIDRDLFSKQFTGLTSGNHVATIVSFEMDGNFNIQRIPENGDGDLGISTIFGAGLGDVNFDGHYSPADIDVFKGLYQSNNTQFNPAADLNGDGLIDYTDVQLLGQRLQQVGADQATMDAYNQFAQSVPEPGATTILALAAVGLLRRRRAAILSH